MAVGELEPASPTSASLTPDRRTVSGATSAHAVASPTMPPSTIRVAWHAGVAGPCEVCGAESDDRCLVEAARPKRLCPGCGHAFWTAMTTSSPPSS